MHNRIQPYVEYVVNRPLNHGTFAGGRNVHNQRMVKTNRRKRKPTPLGQLILDRLEAMGQNRKWLAEEMGGPRAPLSQAAISKWILDGTIYRDKVPRLAKVLGVSIADLLDSEEVSPEAAAFYRAYLACDEEDQMVIKNTLKRYLPGAIKKNAHRK